LSFSYGRNGKPALDAAAGVGFNVAHSGDQALFAFTLGCEIGVDIEAIPSLPDLLQIASHFFCKAEEAELRSLLPGEQAASFAACWSRKEAYIKAKGGGLSIALDSFQVSLLPGQQACFLRLAPDDVGSPWALHELSVASGFAAALAYPAEARNVQIFPPVDVQELLR